MQYCKCSFYPIEFHMTLAISHSCTNAKHIYAESIHASAHTSYIYKEVCCSGSRMMQLLGIVLHLRLLKSSLDLVYVFQDTWEVISFLHLRRAPLNLLASNKQISKSNI